LAFGVAVPDLDVGVDECRAGRRAQAETETEWGPGSSVGDVAAARLLGPTVGAHFLLCEQLARSTAVVEERRDLRSDGLG
jgi:hypothetical protein